MGHSLTRQEQSQQDPQAELAAANGRTLQQQQGGLVEAKVDNVNTPALAFAANPDHPQKMRMISEDPYHCLGRPVAMSWNVKTGCRKGACGACFPKEI